MKPFLYKIAETYYKNFGNEISRFTFVFPNRRAGLFFIKHLSDVADKPVFAPDTLTINDLFLSGSKLQSTDRLGSLFTLYQIFTKHSTVKEDFDAFVFWGEMLLSDFNEIDKYRVDARQIFMNISNLKEIDQHFDIFTPEQIAAIKTFWADFEPVKEGSAEEDFFRVWNVLHSVYEEFNQCLEKDGIATEGMICRRVVEELSKGNDIEQWKDKQFVFVGFNALNPCEFALMKELQKSEQADFYWEYDSVALRDIANPASKFADENVKNFPSKFEIEREKGQLNDKRISVIALPSAVGQSKQVCEILNTLYPPENVEKQWLNTAVVLPDETLLLPLMHSFPKQIEKINVTMGFPLKATAIATLMEYIFELWRKTGNTETNPKFYHRQVTNILEHQYISIISGENAQNIKNEIIKGNLIYISPEILQKDNLLNAIFINKVSSDDFIAYILNILRIISTRFFSMTEENNNFRIEADFMFHYYTALNRMHDVMLTSGKNIDLKINTLIQLIRQLIGGVNIPFEGEPLEGLQVMGVLEARGLDFENVIVASFNEGVFPKKENSNSFIPYNLRRGFGLPTYETNDAITAYNFYRLINRTKQLYFIYDLRTDGTQSAEVSRFLHQLKYLYNIDYEEINVNFNFGISESQEIVVEKTPDIVNKLERFFDDSDDKKYLSASSLKDYIECPLRFYLANIEEIKIQDEVEESIESSTFGNIFHFSMEQIYKPFEGRMVLPNNIDEIVKNEAYISEIIDNAFAKYYFKTKNGTKITLEGNLLLTKRIIRKFIGKMLEQDREYAPFEYVSSEFPCYLDFPLNGRSVNIKGRIDRIDEKDGMLRILDYKTGSGTLEFKTLADVFEKNQKNKPKHVLQTFLYILLYEKYANGKLVVPGIIYVKNLFKDDFSPLLCQKNGVGEITNFEPFREEFELLLSECLIEMFNPEIPFTQTIEPEFCKYCNYKTLCRRDNC
jgi:Inactivated superfamily I helicase